MKTMIPNSNSPPRAGRPGAQSLSRSRRRRNHGATRATWHANRLRFCFALPQPPIQAHGQTASQSHFGHAAAAPELQTLIFTAQFRIKPCRRLRRFHQQPAQHRIALLADPTQPLAATAGVFAGVESSDPPPPDSQLRLAPPPCPVPRSAAAVGPAVEATPAAAGWPRGPAPETPVLRPRSLHNLLLRHTP